MKYTGRHYNSCYVCKATGWWVYHHMIYGQNRRKWSDKYDLVMPTCDDCHDRIHNRDPQLREKVSAIAQLKFEETHSHDEYMKLFMTDYVAMIGGEDE